MMCNGRRVGKWFEGFGSRRLPGSLQAVLVLVLLVVPAMAQDPAKLSIECNVLDGGGEGDSPFAGEIFGKNYFQFDLGAIPPGVSHQIAIKIRNLTNRPISLEQVESGCKCTEVVLPKGDVAPGQAVSGSMTWQFADKLRGWEDSTSFAVLDKTGATALSCSLKASYKDAATFADTLIAMKLPQEESRLQVKVPFFVSDGVRADSISVELSPSLAGARHELSLAGSKGVLSLSMEFPVSQSAVSGEVLLSTSRQSRPSRLMLMVDREQNMRISPTTIEFTVPIGAERDSTKPDSHPEVCSGAVLVDVRPWLKTLAKTESVPKEEVGIKVALKEGRSLKVAHTEIVRGLYRVSLCLHPESKVERGQQGELFIEVFCGGQQTTAIHSFEIR